MKTNGVFESVKAIGVTPDSLFTGVRDSLALLLKLKRPFDTGVGTFTTTRHFARVYRSDNKVCVMGGYSKNGIEDTDYIELPNSVTIEQVSKQIAELCEIAEDEYEAHCAELSEESE